MQSVNHVLISHGFKKIRSEKIEGKPKKALYQLPEEADKSRAKEAISIELTQKGRTLESETGIPESFDQDIQAKPYVLKEGTNLTLMDEAMKNNIQWSSQPCYPLYYLASTAQLGVGIGLLFVNPAIGFPLVSGGISGFVHTYTAKELSVGSYAGESAKAIGTSLICAGASSGVNVVRSAATSYFSNWFARQAAHGVINGASGCTSGVISGGINYLYNNSKTSGNNTQSPEDKERASKIKRKAFYERMTYTFLGGVTGGFAGEATGYLFEHSYASGIQVPNMEDLSWYSNVYGGASGFVVGGLTGGGAKTIHDYYAENSKEFSYSDLAYTMLYSGIAGLSTGAVESHDSALSELNIQQHAHYVSGDLVQLNSHQARCLEDTLRSDQIHLSSVDHRSIDVLLIKSKNEGLNNDELKYIIGKIISGAKDDHHKQVIKAYIEDHFGNQGLIKHLMKDTLSVSDGHIQVRDHILDMKVPEDSLLTQYTNYLLNGELSHLGAHVDMSLEDINKILHDYINQSVLLEPTHIEVGEKIEGVYLRSVDFTPRQFNFEVKEAPNGGLEIDWSLAYKSTFNAKILASHIQESVEGTARGTIILNMRVGDHLSPDIQVVSDSVTFENSKAHIFHYFRVSVNKLLNKSFAKNQAMIETQLTQAGNDMLNQNIQGQVTKLTDLASQTLQPSENVTLVSNISDIEYSNLSWRDGHLGLDLRAHCKPAVLDPETAQQVSQLNAHHEIAFRNNNAIDSSTDLHVKGFVDERTIGDALRNVKHVSLWKWGALNIELDRIDGLKSIHPGELSGFIKIKAEIFGYATHLECKGILQFSGQPYFDPESSKLYIIDPEYSFQAISSGNTISAFVIDSGIKLYSYFNSDQLSEFVKNGAEFGEFIEPINQQLSHLDPSLTQFNVGDLSIRFDPKLVSLDPAKLTNVTGGVVVDMSGQMENGVHIGK